MVVDRKHVTPERSGAPVANAWDGNRVAIPFKPIAQRVRARERQETIQWEPLSGDYEAEIDHYLEWCAGIE